ncbi:hypothetical protein [Clostridium sp.]|nr:hypothetical protein [Clostridium sp.]MDU7241513.1 hypothetical protein [Clostridium sp.]
MIAIFIFIIGVLTLIKVIRSSNDNIEEIRVAIDSTEEEAAGHL